MADQSWITQIPHDKNVLELQLARGAVNALDAEALMGLRQAIETVAKNADVRAIVLTSGVKVFSAGLNLKQAQTFDSGAQRAIVTGLNEGFMALFSCPKPVICALNGPAIAGGLFFVLASDVRIAVPRAALGLAEIRVGVGFPAGPLGIAREMLDANTARRLMMRGQPITAKAAQDAGLIDEIVEPEALMQTALATAAEYAALPPKAYAAVKDQLRRDAIARIRADIDAETNAGADWFTDETAAAMARMIG